MTAAGTPTDSAVAIVGMAGRFASAGSLHEYWRALCEGRDLVRTLSDGDLEAAGVDTPGLDHRRYVRRRGVLDGADMFAASFFGLTPGEAAIVDPQHRVLLECAWEALESAGYDAGRFDGLVGVFAGASASTYSLRLRDRPELRTGVGAMQADLGSRIDFLAARVAYALDLRGPAVVVQASCSTSLVAVHLACQSLLAGDCDIALAGAVSIQVPQAGYHYEPGGIVSPDGRCRAFDAAAQGTVPGSGAGVVVLKRLDRALADRDHVEALILGSAVNNDGSGKIGFTAPSAEGQARVIGEALALAGAEPATIGYVEAHGTGTILGDPIEVQALAQAFRADGDERGRCWLGSVKTNVGHLDAAAGMAGLIKAALALRDGMIPPSLHHERPNPLCELESSPFRVCRELTEWPAELRPRRAGVHSYALGGTNAHLVLQEPPEVTPEPGPIAGRARLLVVSARTPAALERLSADLAARLERASASELADAAYTLQTGRRMFEHRRAVVARTGEEAAQGLRGEGPGVRGQRRERRDAAVVFAIPDLGAHHVAMGRGLYEGEPIFRAWMDRCAGPLGTDLLRCLYPSPGREQVAERALARAELARPATFATCYALARTWMEWGVRPVATIGSGLGEHVAACLAGEMELEPALRLVAERGGLGHPRGQDRFEADLAAATAGFPDAVVLEVGPGTVLTDLARGRGLEAVASMRRQPDERDDRHVLMEALGRLWLAGVPVDWGRVAAPERPRRVALPTYPFERQRCWVETGPAAGPAAPAPAGREAGSPERTVARLWEELMGIPGPSRTANFFDLGGNSLMAARLVSRLNEALGIELSAETVADNPTIESLALVVASGAGPQRGASWVEAPGSGEPPAVPVGLVPLQCWGLETLGAADLWSVSLLVRTRPDLDVGRLRAALGAVVARHPGLRLRVFRDAAGRWRAETRAGRGAAFRTVDLAGVDQADRAAAISRVAGAERRGLDLDRGPALRVACLGSPGSWQVLFVVNHLAFDAFCWSILLEDLAAAYHDVPAYEARHGAAEDDEYAAWTGRLAARARSEAGRAAAEYWCGDRALRAPELPADDPDAPLLDGRTVTVPVSLPPDVTAALVARLKREPGVDMQLALTAAVHRAVEPWSGERRMGMWFLNHGRTSAVATPRTLRLIGFVAYSYPVVLDPAPDGGDVLRLAADLGRQVAAVPHGGLDYETSRYLGDDALCERMAAVRLPGILLNYVGQVRRSLPGPLFTDIDHDVSIQVRDPNAARTLDLEVEASVRDGSLHTVWKYVRDRHREATVAALTRRFREVLLEVAGT